MFDPIQCNSMVVESETFQNDIDKVFLSFERDTSIDIQKVLLELDLI